MDGTLVDTEPYWMSAEKVLVSSYGGTWTDADGLTLVGKGLWDSAQILQDRGVELSADEIVTTLTSKVIEQLESDGVPFQPGARELLAELKEAGVPTALVTMSIRPMAEKVASLIPFEAFDLVVSGDEVDNAKPHPEPYLKAARLLGVDILDCVAIEDSEPGIASAVASGAATIGVPHAVPVAPRPDFTSRDTLAGATLAELSGILEAHRAARTTTTSR
jgi:HAD superfamily hydrolase (TIGR01509 family)